jgi:hypothetical protein
VVDGLNLLSILCRRRRISCCRLRLGFGDVEHLVLMSASIWVAFLWPEGSSTVPALQVAVVAEGGSTVASVLMGCRASRDDAASGWLYWPGWHVRCQRSGRMSSIS